MARRDALGASAGNAARPDRTTVAEAASEWLTAAKLEIVRTRSGEPYKPSALRAYEQALRTKVLPELGHLRLSSVTRNSVQDLVDRLLAARLSPSTVRNAILPLRAIYRRALARSEVLVNPTLGLALPAVRTRRERIADPGEAKQLLEALRPADRAVWATALFAGLAARRAPRRCARRDVDFARGAGPGRAGLGRQGRGRFAPEEPRRPAARAHSRRRFAAELAAHRLRRGPAAGRGSVRSSQTRRGEGVLNTDRPGPHGRAGAWARAASLAADRASIECRHTYASFMIAAGVNAKALCTYMGHSSIKVTFDLYGHLMPGAEAEAAAAHGSPRLERDSGRCDERQSVHETEGHRFESCRARSRNAWICRGVLRFGARCCALAASSDRRQLLRTALAGACFPA